MKKKILILCSLTSLIMSKDFIKNQIENDKYIEKKYENQKRYEENEENNKKRIIEQENEKERSRYNEQKARKNKEILESLKTNENEELSTPFLFDGRVVNFTRGNKEYLRINSKNDEFYILLKEGEANTYSYHIQNKSKVSGGCNNLNANGYYNCWFNFQY
jgi:hypothetical protein